MFIIPDEFPGGIRGKGGLARPRQSEEDRGLTIIPHIGRTVHRQGFPEYRQDEIQGREYPFFDFPCIPGTPYQDHFPGEIQNEDS